MSTAGGFTSEEMELARLIWDECKEYDLLQDSRGKPSYIRALNLAKTLLRKAYDIGLTDPISEIDWRAIIDCRLEYSELLSEFERWLRDNYGRTKSMDSIVYSKIDVLRQDIQLLKETMRALEEATPEELAELGMTEEDRARKLEELRLSIEKLEKELRRIEESKTRREKSMRAFKAPERERTRTLFEYAIQKPETRLGRVLRQTMQFEHVRRLEKTPETPPKVPGTAPSPRPAIRKIKDVISFDEFVKRITEYLSYHGIPLEIINELLRSIEQDLIYDYNEHDYKQLETIYAKVLMYFVNEHLPTHFSIVPALMLREMGTRVEHPREIHLYGIKTKPRIDYLRPQFNSWINDCISVGMTVKYKPITIKPGKTSLIIDPSVPLESALVALREGTVFLINAPAIAYVFMPEEKYVEYYYYIAFTYLNSASVK